MPFIVSLAQMRKAFFQLHLAVFLAGFTAILGKLIGLNEILLVCYRLLITVITLAFLLKIKKQLILLPFKEAIKIFSVGLIIAIHWVTFYGSVKYGNVSIAVVCISGSGFFTALFDPLLFKKKNFNSRNFFGRIRPTWNIYHFRFSPTIQNGHYFRNNFGNRHFAFSHFQQKIVNEVFPCNINIV